MTDIGAEEERKVGRLIDADAAMRIAAGYGLSNGATLGQHSGVADAIKARIAELPAVDAVPVVHGKKLYQSPVDPKSMICFIKCVCKCSVCGEYVARDWNYCSNCGAKMNQEDSDGQG